MPKLTVDGKEIEVAHGATVMDAANQLGIYVPYFCYHHKLSIAANCRMCLVDVEKAPKPMPACATPVTQGMVVGTKSAKAVRGQQGVMEFWLITNRLTCRSCDRAARGSRKALPLGSGAWAT